MFPTNFVINYNILLYLIINIIIFNIYIIFNLNNIIIKFF